MARRGETKRPIDPLQAVVGVTFDAGRHGIEVSQDPVQAHYDRRTGRAKITWKLQGRNMNPLFAVRFANIVLCDVVDESKFAKKAITKRYYPPTANHDGMVTWTFKPRDLSAPPFLAAYDIFCTYGLKEGGEGGSQQTLSLRQSLGLDPSLVMPPGG